MPEDLPEITAQYDGLIGWIFNLMETLGEVGVGLGVLIETVIPPIPSEAILVSAGYLSFEGRMSFWLALTFASLGTLIGAWLWYGLGAALGRERTRNLIGRVPLMEYKDFDVAEAFFNKYGKIAVLSARVVPLVRTFISIPAGIERMNFWLFSFYSFLGSLVANFIWIGAGYMFGPTIQPILERWSDLLSYLVIAVIVGFFVWFFGSRYIKKVRESRQSA